MEPHSAGLIVKDVLLHPHWWRHDCYLQYVFNEGSEGKSPRVLTRQILLVVEYWITASPPKLQVRTFFVLDRWILSYINSETLWNHESHHSDSHRRGRKRESWRQRGRVEWLASADYLFSSLSLLWIWGGDLKVCSEECWKHCAAALKESGWVWTECQLGLCLSLMLSVKGCLFKNAMSRTNSSFGPCWLSVDYLSSSHWQISTSASLELVSFDRKARGQTAAHSCLWDGPTDRRYLDSGFVTAAESVRSGPRDTTTNIRYSYQQL